jgi:hypothetical protein
MEALIDLAKELRHPGVEKLWAAAREAEIRVTKAQVRDLLATQGQRQVYKPLPTSKGASVAEAPGFRYQMDLLDFKNDPSKGNSIILLLIDVFSRQIWARPSPNKTPLAISRVLAAMLPGGAVSDDAQLWELGLPQLPKLPVIISTDAGLEYSKEVADLLQSKGIVHRMRADKMDMNYLAVADRAIQSIKKLLAEGTKAGTEWSEDLPAAVAAYNKTQHSAVHGRPDKVGKAPIQEFLVLQDNADKAQHNNQLLAARKKVLEKTGTLRQPKSDLQKTFSRGFKAKWGGVQKVEKIQGSTVHIRGGAKADIKRVMAVDQNSSDVPVTFGTFSQRAENKRGKTKDFITSLQEWLEDDTKSMVKAAEYLKGFWGAAEYTRILDSISAHNLADVVRLWEPPLELVNRGYYVRTD